MNRSELSQLLLKNDIPLEMRMMLCKLANLGVEFDEGQSEGLITVSVTSEFPQGEWVEMGLLTSHPIEEGMKLFVNGIEVEPGHRYRIGHDAVIYRRR